MQEASIKNFCRLHSLNLDEIFTETSTREDFKPVLLNIMSKYYKTADKMIVCNEKVISGNKDFLEWIYDEFRRMKIEIIVINKNPQEPHVNEKNIAQITENIKNIPSLPEIITKSIELMQDKNTSAETLAKLISNDIGLTARVLKLVNSAYYGFPKQISTIRQAITILGFTTIKGVILSASIYKMFSPKGSDTLFDYKAFWRHSILTAAAARLLSQHSPINTGEDIFAATFLHDIGKVIFAQYDWKNYSHAYKKSNTTPEITLKNEEEYCGLNHCEIGNLVAYSWNLPEIFCDIISYHHFPEKSSKYKNECLIANFADRMAHAVESNEKLTIDDNILEKLCISEENIIGIQYKLKETTLDINNIDSFFE